MDSPPIEQIGRDVQDASRTGRQLGNAQQLDGAVLCQAVGAPVVGALSASAGSLVAFTIAAVIALAGALVRPAMPRAPAGIQR